MKKLSRRAFFGTTAGCVIAGCSLLKHKMIGIDRIIEPGTQPEVFVDGTLEEPFLYVTEGPSWMDNKLYFSNYGNEKNPGYGEIWVAKLDGTNQLYDLGVFPVGTTPLHNGNLAICFIQVPSGDIPFSSGVLEMSPDGKRMDTIVDNYNGLHFGFINDIVTDSKGGLYFTDFRGGEVLAKNSGIKELLELPLTPGPSFYYLNYDKELIRLTEWDEFVVTNGCVLNSDGSKLYLTSNSSEITVFDVNNDGTLSNKRAFAQLNIADTVKQTVGDGMTIDREGNLYIANFHQGIQVFDKNGVSIGLIEMPYRTTNCIFGGNDLSTLFITTFGQKVFSVQTKMKGFQYPIR